MFKGLLSNGESRHASRQARRLAVLASSTASNKGQRSTYKEAVSHINKIEARQQRQRGREGKSAVGGYHRMSLLYSESSGMQDVCKAQMQSVAEEEARRMEGDPLRSRGAGNMMEARRWADTAEEAQRSLRRSAAGSSSSFDFDSSGGGGEGSLGYDDVDPDSGNSIIQTRFDDLVRAALLRYGPPLPAEFVADNQVVTSSATPLQPRHYESSGSSSGSSYSTEGERVVWRDLGADGSTFMLYDEAALATHELLTIIRKVQPDFSFRDHCDGVPFSLLIKNCSYLRAFGGKVHYMRYLRREMGGKTGKSGDQRGRVVLSIAKYKMREAPAQDGIRQGPQPWRYSNRMV